MILAIYGIQDINPQFPEYIHDHNFTLLEGGRVKEYLHLERITGVKYDNTLHRRIYGLLKEAKLFGKRLDIGFVDSVIGRSFISEDGRIRFEANPFEKLSGDLEVGRAFWLDRFVEAYAVRHELAHIFSLVVFFGMFKDNSLLIHFDGGASVSNVSVWLWKAGKLELLDYSFELKRLSSLFNANALNFAILGIKRQEHNSFPGKFMGYAGWGKYDPEIEIWLVENSFFADIWGSKKQFFKAVEEKFGLKLNHINPKHKFFMDIAATVQHYFSREFVEFVKDWQQKTKADYLYYSGGSALNLYTNSLLIHSKIFKDVFIPPTAGDSGLSLGAAAFLGYKLYGFEPKKHLPFLMNWQLGNSQIIENGDIEKVAKAILEKKVIGIYNGWTEAGPRALGNRSIIALPNDKGLAQMISQRMKGREWYRPIAPIMLLDVAKQVTGLERIPEIAKFMLLNFRIEPQYRDKLRGVIHVDGTSRIQVLFSREENPFMWDLLSYLYERYGVLGLINTSFNAKGKPIVHFESQAIEQAKQMQLNAIVINGKYYELSEL